jgi:hypothetical protein
LPVRRRISRRGEVVAPELRSASRSVCAWREYWGGGEAEGRRAWQRLGARLVTPGPHRPACWWHYEPDVPDALRTEPDPPDPREIFRGEPSVEYLAKRTAFKDQQCARFAWIAGSDRFEPVERAGARQRLALLSAETADS